MASPDAAELKAPPGTFQNVTNNQGGVDRGDCILFGYARTKYFMRVTPSADRSSAQISVRIKEGQARAKSDLFRDFRINIDEIITEFRTNRFPPAETPETLPSLDQLLKEINLAKNSPQLK